MKIKRIYDIDKNIVNEAKQNQIAGLEFESSLTRCVVVRVSQTLLSGQ